MKCKDCEKEIPAPNKPFAPVLCADCQESQKLSGVAKFYRKFENQEKSEHVRPESSLNMDMLLSQGSWPSKNDDRGFAIFLVAWVLLIIVILTIDHQQMSSEEEEFLGSGHYDYQIGR